MFNTGWLEKQISLVCLKYIDFSCTAAHATGGMPEDIWKAHNNMFKICTIVCAPLVAESEVSEAVFVR